MREALLMIVVLLAGPVWAAPELSGPDRERLADGTSDRDAALDRQDGLYVLLRNAATWQGDDFAGDAGAAVAPPPDYGFIKDKPEQARGNVYLIEGWLAGGDRWPTKDNHSSDELGRAGDPTWGDRVTRWTVITEKDNAEATIIVLFNDPNAKMATPPVGSKLRIAARFLKLWTIKDTTGKPFTYAVFVGGAAETVETAGGASSASGSGPPLMKIIGGIAVVGGFFFFMRVLMRRVSAGGGGGHMVRDRLEEMRRAREAQALRGDEADEEDAEDLPDDPVAALGTLRERNE